eukprot:11743377-Karenia_brevis.AAC.1
MPAIQICNPDMKFRYTIQICSKDVKQLFGIHAQLAIIPIEAEDVHVYRSLAFSGLPLDMRMQIPDDHHAHTGVH